MSKKSSPSNNMQKFKQILKQCKNVVVLTGAGVSAESGIPTFRGAGGMWRQYQAQSLATPEAMKRNPGLVWEFYHYRREVALQKEPNNAHKAIAAYEKKMMQEGKIVTVITQNVDELHRRAGTENLLELHGSVFKTRCLKCGNVESNHESPICEGLRGKGAPDPGAEDSKISEMDLPRCKKNSCNGLLRPNVVWFGEGLDEQVLEKTGEALDKCDMCMVVGTSSVVYPAAMFAPQVASRGVPVAEFNMESTPVTHDFSFHFQGPCGKTLPDALGIKAPS